MTCVILTFLVFQFVAGMFEAMMVFNKESSLFLNAARDTKVLAHHCLQVFAIVSSMLGFVVIYLNKNMKDKPHFTTWHGLLGVVTVCSIPLAAVGGNIVKYKGLRDMLKVKQSLGELKIMHATGGLMAFTLVMSTMMLALYTDWFTNQVHTFAWYACMFCVSFMAMIVMNQVVLEYLPRTRRPNQSSTKDTGGRAESKKKK